MKTLRVAGAFLAGAILFAAAYYVVSRLAGSAGAADKKASPTPAAK